MTARYRLILAGMLLLMVPPLYAFEWADLWLNKHQRAQRLLDEQPAEAAQLFEQAPWQGVGEYRAGNFAAATDAFAQGEDAVSRYNLGNALARDGQLAEAVAAYDDLLGQEDLPAQLREDAAFNRALIEQLMQQQQQSQSQQQQQDGQQQPQQPSSQGQQQPQSEDAEQGQDQQPSPPQGADGERQDSPSPGAHSEADQPPSDAEAGEADADSEPRDAHEDDQQDAQAPDSASGEGARPSEASPPEQAAGNSQTAADISPMSEDQQATEQWLRRIPEDPSELLRNKLLQAHRHQYPQVRHGENPW
ncbi:MAG TPA: hypothetical protein DD979_12640 [Gammaproteobacteria bacterium]|jgi:Ca-activated chloride channel family protein|nr:hypothetical protein [Gammaproteobacteria bacterium]